MSRTLLFTIISILGLSACSPRVTTNITTALPKAIPLNQKVFVFALREEIPTNSENLGSVKVTDNGFSTNCGFSEVIEKAKIEARKVGGNGIKIVDHTPPSTMGSSCHKIKAIILRIDDIEDLQFNEEPEINPDIDYAIINVYRYGGMGSLISYDLLLGDSVLCRVRNNFKKEIHIKKDGRNTLWARTESKAEIPMNIEIGKTYYIKCAVTTGIMVGRPQLQLIDRESGQLEFESFNAKNQ